MFVSLCVSSPRGSAPQKLRDEPKPLRSSDLRPVLLFSSEELEVFDSQKTLVGGPADACAGVSARPLKSQL